MSITTEERELLDKLWKYYCSTVPKNQPFDYLVASFSYVWVSRSIGLAQDFEAWLNEQGAFVKQENLSRGIDFISEQHRVIFLLKWLQLN